MNYVFTDNYNLETRDNINTLDIFICSHVDVNEVLHPHNRVYKVLCGPDTKQSSELEVFRETVTDITPKEYSYAEGSRIYYLYKECQSILKDYVGICHYRKYFSFFDNVPNMDEIFSQYDIVCGNNVLQKIENNIQYGISLYNQYAIAHNTKDMVDVLMCIYDKKPDYFNDAMAAFSSSVLYPCNMFIMKKDDFLEYCDFVFTVLGEFDNRNGLHCDDDVAKHVIQQKSNYRLSIVDVKYQQRLDGFLLERLTQVFIKHHFQENKIKTYKIYQGEKL